ncbi:MAG: transcription elongation factor Spt5 [Candidatus Bathyarchaeia archaeon]
MSEKGEARFFTLSTTVGQELNVARIMAGRIEANNIPVRAILVPENLKGYIVVEAEGPHIVDQASMNIKHIKSRVPGTLPLSEIEKYITVKSVIDELDINDIVEVVSGPLRGMRARVTDIDKSKEEVTIELLEASFTLPVTVHADYVRLVSKGS